MPNLKEVQPGFEPCMDVQVIAIGGSLLHPRDKPWLDVEFFTRLKTYLTEQIKAKRSVIGIVGGGAVARETQKAVMETGITDKKLLDWYGIFVTQHNALRLKDLLNDHHVKAREWVNQKVRPGIVYVSGGTEPGHTTDYVAVQAAVNAGVNYVIKMSNTPGMYPVDESGNPDTTRIISHATYDELLPRLKDHAPGASGPDKQALTLAREHNITIICVGPDFENLKKCLCGEEFVGSVITTTPPQSADTDEVIPTVV